jgi:hypothetical protein
MPGNPLVDQGILNRVKASLTLANFPQLNVNAQFLDKDGLSMRAGGGSMTTTHETMAGTVQSPEPYVMRVITIALLRTQALSDLWKTQMETNTVLGPGVIYPDVAVNGLTQFQLYNLAINDFGDLLLNGTTPIFGVQISGYYITNNQMWN